MLNYRYKFLLTFFSLPVMFSALLALRQRMLWDPWRLKNSIESKPFPSDDTNIAEFILPRVQRSDMEVERSSCNIWKCFKGKIQQIRNILHKLHEFILPGCCSVMVGMLVHHTHCLQTENKKKGYTVYI